MKRPRIDGDSQHGKENDKSILATCVRAGVVGVDHFWTLRLTAENWGWCDAMEAQSPGHQRLYLRQAAVPSGSSWAIHVARALGRLRSSGERCATGRDSHTG